MASRIKFRNTGKKLVIGIFTGSQVSQSGIGISGVVFRGRTLLILMPLGVLVMS
jgi:hypothetical protein